MIDRYTLPEIADIWSDTNRFSIWLRIEIFAVEALSKEGIVPAEALKTIKDKANFDVDRILEIEEEVKHDVIAFLTNVAEYVGEDARYIHYGMTSSDILDTALAIQMVQAGENTGCTCGTDYSCKGSGHRNKKYGYGWTLTWCTC